MPIFADFQYLAELAGLSVFLLILAFFQANVHDARDPRVIVDKLWRVRPMLDRIRLVNLRSWELSHRLSIDEQTIGFQGRAAGAVRITYKTEGDGFQVFRIPFLGYSVGIPS